MNPQPQHFYEFGPFRLDAVERLLLREAEPLPLTPKSFELLLALVERHGHIVEKQELMQAVWPDTFVEETNLTKNIFILRQALGEPDDGRRYIETVPKRGYRFVAQVREVREKSEELAATEPVNSQTAVAAEPENNTQTTAGGYRKPAAVASISIRPALWRLLAVALGVSLTAVAVISFTRRSEDRGVRIKSLAVLPLENLSGDPAQEYFADGMTDALIGDLAKIGALRVISRTSAMHYKGTKKSLPEIASELGVDVVVEGTVQRSGDRVLIRAQLIHVGTERQLWGETYERDLRDVLKLQSEVAQTIAREIQTRVTPAEQARLAQTRVVNRKAYDDYLQGRYLFWNKRAQENLEKAIEYFQSAIKEDPAYAQAYVGIADCYNQLGTLSMSALHPLAARRQAEEFAGKALEIDSELAEAHVALGYVKHRNWDWAAAEAEFKRALALNPNYADAHIHYAQYLMTRTRVDEAIAEANRARALDPFSLDTSVLRGFVLENARRYPESVEQLRSIIAMHPNQYLAHWYLGNTYAANGQFAEAIASSEKAAALSGRAPGALSILGMAYGLAGRKEEARQVLDELLALSRRRYVTAPTVANVYIGLGDKDQAFLWLEKAFQERSNYLVWLKVWPLLDPLRSDPRYDDLLRRIGLEP